MIIAKIQITGKDQFPSAAQTEALTKIGSDNGSDAIAPYMIMLSNEPVTIGRGFALAGTTIGTHRQIQEAVNSYLAKNDVGFGEVLSVSAGLDVTSEG